MEIIFVLRGIKKGAWKCKVIEKIADCTVLHFLGINCSINASCRLFSFSSIRKEYQIN